jgi:hypothetical protein
MKAFAMVRMYCFPNHTFDLSMLEVRVCMLHVLHSKTLMTYIVIKLRSDFLHLSKPNNSTVNKEIDGTRAACIFNQALSKVFFKL